eukprot:scaffold2469_cov239-Pinguiococcus_pyrenoidosus.AAC.1
MIVPPAEKGREELHLGEQLARLVEDPTSLLRQRVAEGLSAQAAQRPRLRAYHAGGAWRAVQQRELSEDGAGQRRLADSAALHGEVHGAGLHDVHVVGRRALVDDDVPGAHGAKLHLASEVAALGGTQGREDEVLLQRGDDHGRDLLGLGHELLRVRLVVEVVPDQGEVAVPAATLLVGHGDVQDFLLTRRRVLEVRVAAHLHGPSLSGGPLGLLICFQRVRGGGSLDVEKGEHEALLGAVALAHGDCGCTFCTQIPRRRDSLGHAAAFRQMMQKPESGEASSWAGSEDEPKLPGAPEYSSCHPR